MKESHHERLRALEQWQVEAKKQMQGYAKETELKKAFQKIDEL